MWVKPETFFCSLDLKGTLKEKITVGYINFKGMTFYQVDFVALDDKI